MEDFAAALVRLLFWPLFLVVEVYFLIFETFDILPKRWQNAILGSAESEPTRSGKGLIIRFIAAMILSIILLLLVGLLLTAAFWLGWLGFGWILAIGIVAAMLLAGAPVAAILHPPKRRAS